MNFCAPELVRNMDFVKTLGNVLGRPSFMPAPAFMIRLIMGELGASLLNSQRLIPDKLTRYSFKFQYPDVNSALSDILK